MKSAWSAGDRRRARMQALTSSVHSPMLSPVLPRNSGHFLSLGKLISLSVTVTGVEESPGADELAAEVLGQGRLASRS